MEPSTALDFPPFRLNLRAAQLERGDDVLALRPKAFALLHHFVQNPGKLLTKEVLLNSVWPGRIINEGGLSELIRELRKVLGDDPKFPRFIETVHGRGYRFVGPLAGPPAGTVLRSTAAPSGFSVVGRETELERLHGWFLSVAAGVRQLVFVTGEPGIGKTTLVEAFRQQLAAVAADQAPQIVHGQCIEQYGAGEAYLPVLDAVGRLARMADGAGLIATLRHHAPTWLVQMPALCATDELERLERRVLGATRERMLREMAEVLEVVTAARPLILILEDLHWSDYSTLDLLSFVAQRQEPARLMIVATFRPIEVYTRDHPLKSVKQELQMRSQCVELPLPCLTEAAVADYLETRFAAVPSVPALAQLAPVVHRRTDGHPLFMVNVADYVAALDFAGLPDSVEQSIPDSVRQMIEKQIERLSADEQRLLEVAAVAGAEFSAASVAAGLVTDDLDAIEDHCAGLVRRAQFLAGRGSTIWPDGTLAGRYGFIHALYQNVLYFRIAPGRRARLHQRIGEREEGAWGEQAPHIASELAAHFEAGQDYVRALHYLTLAGRRAARRCANREAIDLLTHGLDLLRHLPDSAARRRHELALDIALGAPLIHSRGYAAADVAKVYGRARELYAEVGETAQLFSILWGLWLYHVVRGDHPVAFDLGRQLQALERSSGVVFPWADYATGCSQFWLGRFAESRLTLEQAVANYNCESHADTVELHSQDPKVVSLLYRAWGLWIQGYPDQALDCCMAAAAWAEELAHPFTLAFAYNYCAVLRHLRREHAPAHLLAESAVQVSVEHGFPFWHAWGDMMRARTLVDLGSADVGIAALRRGLAAYETTGAGMGKTLFLALLADACVKAGQAQAGLEAVTLARAFHDITGEDAVIAELHRLEGELVLARTSTDELAVAETRAEACFLAAIGAARRQGAKSWELRATTSLARLWQAQGRKAEAHSALAAICAWFTEGFDTSDWQDALMLRDRLVH